MTKNVISVSPETKIEEIAQLLTRNRIHGVPVVEDGKLVGIIAEDDFFTKDSVNLHLPSYINLLKEAKISREVKSGEKEKLHELFNARAKDIMTPNCATLSPDTQINDAVKIFKETKFNALPVVDKNNGLAGIVALADIINLLADYQKNESE